MLPSVSPVSIDHSGKIVDLNTEIITLREVQLGLVDLFAFFDDNQQLWQRRLHPRRRGQTRIAELVMRESSAAMRWFDNVLRFFYIQKRTMWGWKLAWRLKAVVVPCPARRSATSCLLGPYTIFSVIKRVQRAVLGVIRPFLLAARHRRGR
jgi:hypothetical protein